MGKALEKIRAKLFGARSFEEYRIHPGTLKEIPEGGGYHAHCGGFEWEIHSKGKRFRARVQHSEQDRFTFNITETSKLDPHGKPMPFSRITLTINFKILDEKILSVLDVVDAE